MNIKETKKNIIQAGHKAVEELIKVAKEPIVDSDDDISADRLKNAAATKKLAIFDAFEILNKIQAEENLLEGRVPEESKEKIVDSEDDVSADRLKNAAATKKLAIFDAFEILNRIQEEENLLEGKAPEERKEKVFKGFAEGRSK